MKRSLCLLVLFIQALFTASCTGVRQLNDLAIVTAVGLDVGERPGTTKISVQIIRPADARGQTGAPSGGTGEPIYSVSAEGKSIFEAIRNLGRISSRRVYWAHNFLIVMHESYARRGIEDMIDFFTRNHELRMETWVAVTPDPPDELISTVTGLEVVPGEAIDRLFHDNQFDGRAPASNMMTLEESFLSRASEPVIAKLQLVSREISNKKPEEHGSIKQVELAGAAAFNKANMVGWLSLKESKGLKFFLESFKDGNEVVFCPNDNKKNLTLEIKNGDFKVTPSYQNQVPHFFIRLTVNADVVENGCQIDSGKIRKELQTEIEQQLQSEIESVINKAQRQYHSDFLKLGDVFRNKYPQEWRIVGKDWNTAFSAAEITVQVKSNIKSRVLKARGMEVQ